MNLHNPTKALVLFSGGQDSTICLAWALQKHDHVETIGFNYGQRHSVELECRKNVLRSMRTQFPAWAEKLGEDHLFDVSALSVIGETAMTKDIEIVYNENGLPNTFVPGRNLLFFTFAASLGFRRDIPTLVGGMCETDFSGYPDCRNETLQSLNKTINLGMDKEFEIQTPLMHIDKAASWHMAKEIGGETLVNIIIEDTHTCYKGDRGQKHQWGYGCGECPACDLRAKGYTNYLSM